MKYMRKLLVRTGNGSLPDFFWNLLSLGFLLLPIGVNISTPFFVASAFLGIVQIILKKNRLKKKDLVFLCLPLLFLLTGVSLVYTENLKTGSDLIVRMLPLIIFPIIFLFIEEEKGIVRRLFIMLLFGILISMAINLFYAFSNSLSIVDGSLVFDSSFEGGYSFYESFNHGGNHFFGTRFAKTIHPTYLSLYILTSLLYFSYSRISFFYVIMIFLLFSLFLLSSRAALMILAVYIFLYIIHSGNGRWKNTMTALIVFSGILMVLLNPRVKTFYERIVDFGKKENFNYTTSEQSRILIYKSCLELIKHSPLVGYGIGDANNELFEEYRKNSYLVLVKNKYNAHSQYFQTWLQAGILTFFILIFPLGYLLFKAVGEPFVLAMLLTFVIIMAFESLLVRYNGIMFYAILMPFILRRERHLFK